MKPYLFAVIAVITVAVVIFFRETLGETLRTLPCPAPEKPRQLPAGVIWRGGCDGGDWIELVSRDSMSYRFRIYEGYTGGLMLDADFMPDGDSTCSFADTAIPGDITHFYMHPEQGGQLYFSSRCFLQARYPDHKGKYKDEPYE